MTEPVRHAESVAASHYADSIEKERAADRIFGSFDQRLDPLVLRCQASFSGKCLARTDGYGFECPPGECRLADDDEAYVADLTDQLAERMRRLVEGDGARNDG